MSTCSTATSALRCGPDSRRRRRAPSDTSDAADVVHGSLERRLVDLERDWDAYKSGRSSPPPRRRRRRSYSATGTPSSAVTFAAAPDALLLSLYRCSSPRTLVSSLQQAGSTATDSNSDGAAEIVVAAGSPTSRSYEEEGLSSVCSVEEPGNGKNSAVAPASSSCSCCPCRCALCCGGNSASSSCAGAVAPAFSLAAGGIVEERARKSDEARSVAGKVGWISAIALVIMGFAAMAILELGVDDRCAEYLVPT
ncbi:unnamed protein product [Urochloa humidicola]